MSKGERNLRLHIMVAHEESAAIRERMAEVNSPTPCSSFRIRPLYHVFYASFPCGYAVALNTRIDPQN